MTIGTAELWRGCQAVGLAELAAGTEVAALGHVLKRGDGAFDGVEYILVSIKMRD